MHFELAEIFIHCAKRIIVDDSIVSRLVRPLDNFGVTWSEVRFVWRGESNLRGFRRKWMSTFSWNTISSHTRVTREPRKKNKRKNSFLKDENKFIETKAKTHVSRDKKKICKRSNTKDIFVDCVSVEFWMSWKNKNNEDDDEDEVKLLLSRLVRFVEKHSFCIHCGFVVRLSCVTSDTLRRNDIHRHAQVQFRISFALRNNKC